MVFTGAVLWGAYGVLRGAPSIILWNAVAAMLAAMVLVLKLRRPRA
jgi:MtN3 and saliva related transmembrane protein